jgi:lysyl-tRNA synthetase class 2
MAYADYNDLMVMAEEIFSQVVFSIHGTYKIMCIPFDSDVPVEIDFTPPFKRYDFIKEIELECGRTLPTDLTTPEANQFLQELCKLFNVECSNPRTTARLLDKLCGRFIESKCKNPTFVINHPLIMSPLAKWHRNNPNITERFELFIMGFEFANAYTELNDPTIQRETFNQQMLAKASGDEEAQSIDETFVSALEYGLPPTGGFGIGIDRLTMALSKSNKIQDVILFPTLRQN